MHTPHEGALKIHFEYDPLRFSEFTALSAAMLKQELRTKYNGAELAHLAAAAADYGSRFQACLNKERGEIIWCALLNCCLSSSGKCCCVAITWLQFGAGL